MAIQQIKIQNEKDSKSNQKYLYRNDDYGTGETNPRNVIAFEMSELGNVDIPCYLFEHYGNAMAQEEKSMLEKVYQRKCDENFDENEAKRVADTIVHEMERIWQISIASVLWLAEYDAVVEIYDGNKDNIEEYPTSNYILSDLGYEGALFAYPK